MKLMTLNVLFGGGERLDALCAIVAAEQPDVLVMQECLDWEDGKRLGAMAVAMGVPDDEAHVFLGHANRRSSGRRFHVGVVSRTPIARRALHAPPAMAHCLIEVEIEHRGAPFVVFGTHLVAATEEGRLREVDELHRLATPAGASALLGDLNALARHDPYAHDLAERLVACRIDKYGHPPSFEVMRRILDAGWVDALHARPKNGEWITARRGHGPMSLEARTDYVLLSPGASAHLESARVVDVGDATDHNAVVAELR